MPTSAFGTKRTSNSRPAMSAFGGKSGHDADLTRCPLMTHSGHLPRDTGGQRLTLTFELYVTRRDGLSVLVSNFFQRDLLSGAANAAPRVHRTAREYCHRLAAGRARATAGDAGGRIAAWCVTRDICCERYRVQARSKPNRLYRRSERHDRTSMGKWSIRAIACIGC